MPNELIKTTAHEGQHRKRGARYAVLSLVLVAMLGVWYKLSHRTKATPPPAPQSVETQTIALRTVPDVIDTYGTIVSPQTVEITPQTSGVITSVRITDGQAVRRGQLLFTIDPRPLQAALAQARGTLRRDAALATDAEDTATRYAPLAATGAMDEKTYVTARNTADSLAGTTALDRAQITSADLSLGYTQIRSPISGRAGAVQIKAGNVLVGGSTSPLVTINVSSRVEANFALPLDQVATIREAAGGRSGSLSVIASDPDTKKQIAHGSLYFLDNSYDTTSGTLTMRARFTNANGAFTPGQFVDVRVILSEGANSIAVPESALQQGQQGSYIYLLANGHAQLRQLNVVRLVDGLAVVSKGVQPGETLILTVPDRLRAGDAVQSSNQPALNHASGADKK